MQDLNDKITGGSLTAPEWNEVPSEIQNIIGDLGQILSSGDLDQLGKAIAAMCGSANFYLETGIADAYVCEVIGPKQGLNAVTGLTAVNDGLLVRFRPGNNNTGASTVNVNGTGVKTIVRPDGTTLQAGDLTTGRDANFRWDQAAGKFALLNLPKGVYDVETITGTAITLDGDDHVILVDDDTAGSTVTITLPVAASNLGRVYHIKKLGSTANVVLDGDGANIDGAPTHTLSTQFDARTIICDSSNWSII